MQRIELGGEDVRYPFAVFSNLTWGGDAQAVRKAVIVFHGMGRNAGGYFSTAQELLRASDGRDAETLVIAPQYFATADARRAEASGLPQWRGSRWNQGADAESWVRPLSSFQVIDDLLRVLMDAKRFPRLEHIVLAGHSAGAQLLHRYAVLNDVDGGAAATGKRITYVIANPSSYLYLTPERPSGSGFAPYDTVVCPDYNQYRYGTDKLLRYAQGAGHANLFQRFAGRHVIYLLGSEDKDPNHTQLDRSCGAQAGGRHRLERGLNYIRYEQHLAISGMILSRSAFEVIGVGHTQSRMFGSKCGVRLLFGLADERNAAGAACRDIPR